MTWKCIENVSNVSTHLNLHPSCIKYDFTFRSVSVNKNGVHHEECNGGVSDMNRAQKMSKNPVPCCSRTRNTEWCILLNGKKEKENGKNTMFAFSELEWYLCASDEIRAGSVPIFTEPLYVTWHRRKYYWRHKQQCLTSEGICQVC